MREVVLVDGLRTPFVKAGGEFNFIPAYELGRIAVSELLAKCELDASSVDETIFGNCGQPAEAANIARVISLNAGIPKQVPAVTVHRNCGSGMEAIAGGVRRIESGANVVVAGGVESMSNIPLLFPKGYSDFLHNFMRAKYPLSKVKSILSFRPHYFKPRIALLEGLTDPFCGLNMGETAELLAREWNISRGEQDQFALESHEKVLKAQDEGKFLDEITTVYVPPKYEKIVTADIGPRRGQTAEQLAKLPPYFDRRYGSVTVGNSCQVTDGAVAALLMERQYADSLGYKPLAKIRSWAFCGIEPERMGLAPVIAANIALKNSGLSPAGPRPAGLSLKEMGLIEINEAFAAQVLAVLKASESHLFSETYWGGEKPLGEIRRDILNVNGGAIALGHPVGASGARIVVALAKEMNRRSLQFGLAMICIGGGQGGAMVLERTV